MAYSYNVYTGNGSTTQFTIGFSYIRREHVKVYVAFVDTAYTYVNSTTVQLATAPGAGVRVEVRRVTPAASVLVDFADGSTLVAADLDTSNLQHLYLEQELDDSLKQTVSIDPATGLPSAANQRITNVADPTSPQDAATKAYTDAADALRLKRDGTQAMTGALPMGGFKVTGAADPASAQDLATKAYVDTTTVASAGDSMTGNLAMGGNKVTGLGTPTANADAVTKSYLDAYINTAYLGPLASDPAVRPSGGALQAGDIYFNTTQNILKAYTGSVWVISAAAGNIVRWRKTASAGNTTLSGVDDLGVTLSYVVGNEQVYLNGALQTRGVDYTAGTGTSITLTPALLAGDVVELHAVQGYVSATIAPGSINDALVAPAAGIQYSKLALSNSITSADLVDGTIVNADVNASAGITAGKLNFTQAGTGATARTIDSKLKDVVSVKDFGAVGDGVANDTAAINAALTASNTVFFPAGTYLTSGNHNIQNKSLYGVSQERSIIKLSGTNTNTSLLVNGASISTPWGSGSGCILQNLNFQGNWDGSTQNTETNISNIGALFKWWSGSYVRVNDCEFQNSFGFGIFCYRLGYSYFNGCHVNTHAKNGIHIAGPSGSDSVTSTSINFCSIHSCRGRATDATHGGNAIYLANAFSVSVYGCVVEDVDDGFRLDGADNRSVSLFYLHAEQCSGYDVFYVGSGQDFGLYQCVLGSTNKLYQSNPQFTKYTAINNFGLEDTYELPIVQGGPTQISLVTATPQNTITSVTVGPGTWQLTGNWIGTHSSGTGSVSSAQAYTINTSAAIPGYTSSFSVALLKGQLTSPVNEFNCLSGSLSLTRTVTSSTTFYLYGGPTSITGAINCVVAGHLRAVKVNGP